MFKVKIEYSYIQAVLGMPDIDMLNIIKINCDTIGTHGNDSVHNCSTNTARPNIAIRV